MLLSIGMIVKNEEKYLRQCLEGIKPVLEQVHSELIIADTGSTDSTMEIAKEYTKNVYQIEWRNDFAWARNTTLDRARGKWFMFLDADEIFEDTKDLIEFFNSGEYEKYKSALHGMVILARGERSDSTAKRLFKISKNIRFDGKIHERPINTLPPLKELKSYSVHYGYLHDDTPEGDKRKEIKFKRNIEPLLELYKENPGDLRTVVHIVKEYSFNNKITDFLKFLEIGLTIGEKIPNDPYYNYLCLTRADYYFVSKQFDETVNAVRDYFKNVRKLYTLTINMRIMEARSLKALGRNHEAAEAYKEAWKLYAENDRGNIDNTDLEINSTKILSDDMRNSVPAELINYYANSDDLEKALEWGKCSVFGTAVAVDLYMKAQMKNIAGSEYKKAIEILNFLAKHFGTNSIEFKTAVEALENAVKSSSEKFKLAAALSKLNHDDEYVNLQKLRAALGQNDTAGVDGALTSFINTPKPLSSMYGDVIFAAVTRGADFTSFVEKMGLDTALAAIPGIIRTNDGFDAISHYSLEYIKNTDFNLKTARVLRELLRSTLTASAKEDDKTITAFNAYVTLSRRYIDSVYNAKILTDDACELLSESERFAYYAGKAYDLRDKGDYVNFVASLRKAVNNDNVMSGAVMAVINRFQRELDEENRKANEKRERLENETAALKKIITDLIYAGNKDQASQILASYSQINPTDPEIGSIKKMLERL